jgi:hypothetical protein
MSCFLTIQLFSTSVIRGVSKKNGREYFGIEGKMFPKAEGYGDKFFFDRVLVPDLEQQIIEKPFNQNSVVEIGFGMDGLVLEIKVVRPGNGPAEVKDLEKIYAKANAAKAQAQQPAQNGAPTVAPDFKRVS